MAMGVPLQSGIRVSVAGLIVMSLLRDHLLVAVSTGQSDASSAAMVSPAVVVSRSSSTGIVAVSGLAAVV